MNKKQKIVVYILLITTFIFGWYGFYKFVIEGRSKKEFSVKVLDRKIIAPGYKTQEQPALIVQYQNGYIEQVEVSYDAYYKYRPGDNMVIYKEDRSTRSVLWEMAYVFGFTIAICETFFLLVFLFILGYERLGR